MECILHQIPPSRCLGMFSCLVSFWLSYIQSQNILSLQDSDSRLFIGCYMCILHTDFQNTYSRYRPCRWGPGRQVAKPLILIQRRLFSIKSPRGQNCQWVFHSIAFADCSIHHVIRIRGPKALGTYLGIDRVRPCKLIGEKTIEATSHMI